jgi:hypothetical protein
MADDERRTTDEERGNRKEGQGIRDKGRGRNKEVGGRRDEKGGKNRIGKSGVWEELRSRDQRMEEARREGEGEKPEGEL